MFHKNYSNFVRPTSPTAEVNNVKKYEIATALSGEEVKRIYLDEVSNTTDVLNASHSSSSKLKAQVRKRPSKRKHEDKSVSDSDLLLAAQGNDVDTIKDALNACPDKIRITDDYGWSLLMIACQANSLDAVKELLSRDVDTTVRDKAGNSAQSLVIQNKNFVIADLLVSHKRKNEVKAKTHATTSKIKARIKPKEFHCEVCNQIYPNEEEHMLSTVHNLNASKGKKIPACYAIPQTNKGYQIMLKVGWDRESGLGPEGAGKKYPIKAKQKKDRKGLGHEKKKEEVTEDTVKSRKNKRTAAREYESNKKLEINFRREFY